MPYDVGPLDEGRHRGARRLLALADYLDTVHPHRYNQGVWRCGTTFCAFGHAVEGLGEQLGIRWWTPPDSRVEDSIEEMTICRTDGSLSFSNIYLAAEVFELTGNEAMMLFGGARGYYLGLRDAGEGQLTPALVARGLRAFAAEKMEEVNAV